MPRPRTSAVNELKTKLIARLRDGFHRPGARFFSNRAIATRFGVSYQTAHRLVSELVEEGWLERRAASGTFVAGRREEWRGVELIFAERARREESFGARLLGMVRGALDRAGLAHRTRWAVAGERAETVAQDWYPVIWEHPELAVDLAAARRFVLVLEDRPVRGLAASFADSVSVDDYSGGMAAAEWLRTRVRAGRVAVLAGPGKDARNRMRVEGFLSVTPRARVVRAGTWFFEEALRVAPRVLDAAGVFCANDRLAAAVVVAARAAGVARPELVGFDDAPVAERLNITTIAIPWEEVAAAAAEIARRRMAGDIRTAAGLVFSPRPLAR
jgi:DNA-binding transcriptional regulator YhcF (GntR family)